LTTKSATDFLIRTVLDETFRELALNDPHSALEEYDLTDRQREIILARDSRLLELLGQAVDQREPVADPLPAGFTGTHTPQPPDLPEVKLLLRLTPFVAPDAETNAKLSYEASLRPWPDQADPESAPATDGATPAVSWMIRIAPTVVAAQETGTEVSYSASITPLATQQSETQPPTADAAAQPGTPPWYHHTESAAARAAARNVRQCDPTQRFGKLLELIRTLQIGDQGG
jgi:hypothetical protein